MFDFVGKPRPESPEEVKQYLKRVSEPKLYGSVSGRGGTYYFEEYGVGSKDLAAEAARRRYYGSEDYYRTTENIKGSKNKLHAHWDSEVSRIEDHEAGIRVFRVKIGMARSGMRAYGLSLDLPERYQITDISDTKPSTLDVAADEIYGQLNGVPIDDEALSEWHRASEIVAPKIEQEAEEMRDFVLKAFRRRRLDEVNHDK